MNMNSLPFGNSISKDFNCPYKWSDHFHEHLGKHFSLHAPKKHDKFHINHAIQSSGDLSVGSFMQSEYSFERQSQSTDTVILAIPLSGERKYKSGKKETKIIGCRSAYYIGIDDYFSFETSGGCDLVFFINTDSLKRILNKRKDLGVNNLQSMIFSKSYEIVYNNLKHDYLNALINMVTMFDNLKNSENRIVQLGIDDLIQRTITSLLYDYNQEVFDNGEISISSLDPRVLDYVCDNIIGFSGRVLNITEMECLTGLSVQTLNLLFHKKFGCSPREWQRNEHLSMARKLLFDSNNNQSLKEIARVSGFSSLRSFSRFYMQRFGELPSDTLKKR